MYIYLFIHLLAIYIYIYILAIYGGIDRPEIRKPLVVPTGSPPGSLSSHGDLRSGQLPKTMLEYSIVYYSISIV